MIGDCGLAAAMQLHPRRGSRGNFRLFAIPGLWREEGCSSVQLRVRPCWEEIHVLTYETTVKNHEQFAVSALSLPPGFRAKGRAGGGIELGSRHDGHPRLDERQGDVRFQDRRKALADSGCSLRNHAGRHCTVGGYEHSGFVTNGSGTGCGSN